MPSMRGISTSSVRTSGFKVADHLARDQRVGGRADAGHVGLAVDDLGEQAAHEGGVVDDDDAGLLHGLLHRGGAQKRSTLAGGGRQRGSGAGSCATSASPFVDASFFTIALPLAGRKHTLRACTSSTSLLTTAMRSVRR